MIRQIGDIENGYGGLEVKMEVGKYYWSIEDCRDTYWEEIPEELYNQLNKCQDSMEGTND